jgi:hypothetical protein
MADQVQDERGQDAEISGFGGALTEAVSHLKDEPLLSFGIAAVIVVGAIATVGTESWVPVVAAGTISLAALVAWIARAWIGRPPRAEDGMRIGSRIEGAVDVGDDARLQTYRGPVVPGLQLSSKVRGRRRGAAATIGTRSKVQDVEITTESQGPRESR